MPDPHRRLSDPRELTALAHPVRMAIIELLTISGPLTATELADRLDESPANCSWHLRKLAQHGFVEEAEGGKGRQRPWQVPGLGFQWDDEHGDGVGRGAAGRAGAVGGDDGPGARPAARGPAADAPRSPRSGARRSQGPRRSPG